MTELIVVTGPPGAGKSTVSRVLSSMFSPSARVAGDDFFGFVDQGYIAPWTAAAHAQNGIVLRAAAAAAGRLAAGGFAVTYDGVVGPWFLPDFGAATGLAHLHYAVLLPPVEMCVERVRSRVGHGFTDIESTRHMYDEFADAAVDERHLFSGCDAAEVLATSIHHEVLDGSLIRATA